MTRRIATGLALALALSMGMASAADAKRRPVVKAVAAKVAPAFKAADADASRQLDSNEWASAGYNAAAFTKVDMNSNGTVGYLEALIATLAKLKAGRK